MTVRGPLVITGTGTGVGKTIVAAAIAAAARSTGLRVGFMKPAQTGPDSDVDVVSRLAEPAYALALTTYPDALEPAVAARVSGRPAPALPDVLTAVASTDADLIVIEGSGGLLVPMATSWTIGDLAIALAASVVVVTGAGVGTINHTALTLQVLRTRSIEASLVIGSWPASPNLLHRTNLEELGPLAGRVPEGAGAMDPEAFQAAAPEWLGPSLYGRGTFA
jgi:dethiobiotin synthetase